MLNQVFSEYTVPQTHPHPVGSALEFGPPLLPQPSLDTPIQPITHIAHDTSICPSAPINTSAPHFNHVLISSVRVLGDEPARTKRFRAPHRRVKVPLGAQWDKFERRLNGKVRQFKVYKLISSRVYALGLE